MQNPPALISPARPQFPEEEQLKCPRCESMNTKFCYYNNYNLSQPRHFCKSCRRYWTNGGALRNIPVGGGTRKKSSKRSSTSKRVNSDPRSEPVKLTRRVPAAASSSTATASPEGQMAAGGDSGLDDPTHPLEVAKFSSLLGSNGQFRNIFEDLNPNGSGLKLVDTGGFGEDMSSVSYGDPGKVDGGGATASGGENYLESCEWGNSNGWPDLAIYTPRF